jgi:5-deoxy-D-glucuronate isomerase
MQPRKQLYRLPRQYYSSKAKSIVNSILHGSKDSWEAQNLNETYSKILSRGKSIHELVIHNVKPEAMDDYSSLVKEVYPKISKDSAIPARLFGSWKTEIGELDQACISF